MSAEAAVPILANLASNSSSVRQLARTTSRVTGETMRNTEALMRTTVESGSSLFANTANSTGSLTRTVGDVGCQLVHAGKDVTVDLMDGVGQTTDALLTSGKNTTVDIMRELGPTTDSLLRAGTNVVGDTFEGISGGLIDGVISSVTGKRGQRRQERELIGMNNTHELVLLRTNQEHELKTNKQRIEYEQKKLEYNLEHLKLQIKLSELENVKLERVIRIKEIEARQACLEYSMTVNSNSQHSNNDINVEEDSEELKTGVGQNRHAMFGSGNR